MKKGSYKKVNLKLPQRILKFTLAEYTGSCSEDLHPGTTPR